MPQESNNLIIGATISLLSVLLTFILSSTFQWMRENRAREWMIADRKYQRRLEVLSVRLKEIEDYINQLFDIAVKLLRYEVELIQTNKVDETQAFYIDFNQIIGKISSKQSSVLNLHDEELANLSRKFEQYILGELDIANSLEKRIKNNELLKMKLKKRGQLIFLEKLWI